MNRRHLRAVVLAGLVVLGALGPTVVAELIANEPQVPYDGGDDGIVIATANGPQISLQGAGHNISNPANGTGDGQVTLNTTAGNITFSGPTQASATIAPADITGDWTNVSNIDAAGSLLKITAEDKQTVGVGGAVTHVNISDSIAVDDGSVDFAYGGSGGMTQLYLPGLTADAWYQLVDQSGDRLIVAQADETGTLRVTVPNSDHLVQIQTADPRAVAAQHTTDTDFNNAQELTNVSVGGSGSSASVTLGAQSDFEIAYRDQSNNLKFVGPTGSSPTDTGEQAGDVGGVADVDGDGGLEIAFVDNADDYVKIVDASQSTTNLSVEAYDVGGIGDIDDDGDLDVVYRDKSSNLKYVDVNGNVADLGVDVNQPGGVGDIDDDGDQDVAYEDSSGNLKYVDDAGNVVDLGVDSSFAVGGVGDIDGDGDLDVAYESAADNDIRFVDDAGNTIDTNAGGDTVGGIGDVDSDGDQDAAYRASDEYLKFVDASGTVGNTSQKIGGVFGVGDIDGDGGSTTGTYISQNETVDASELAANVTAENASVNVSVEEWTGSQWQLVNFSNLTATGNHTIDISAASNDKLRSNVEFRALTGDTTAELHDETWLFNSSAPELDEAQASPQGGTTVGSSSITLSVPLNDSDFDTPQGDNVTVDFYEDGSFVGTVDRTSNGTASVTISESEGGTHTWGAVAHSQNYSEPIAEAGNFTFALPSNLTVRNESNASEIITGANISVTFFGSDGTVIERSDDDQDGNISLDGVPADQTFVVEASAPGYHERRIVIDSLIEQQDIYLLNQSVVTAVAVDFQLDDRTGQFVDDDTEFLVQRVLNQSGSSEWQTIVGSRIGANDEVATLLERDQRYRIVVRNDGRSRVLGSYTASKAVDPEIIPIGQVEIQADVDEEAVFGAQLRELDSGRDVQFSYYDPADDTSQLQYEIVFANNTNKVLVSNTTVSNPSQQFTFTEPIASGLPENVSFIVNVHAERDEGPNFGASVRVGDVRSLGDQWGIDRTDLELIGWVLIYASAGLMTLRSPRLAALGTPIIGAIFAQTGIVSLHPLPIALAGATGLLYVAGRRSI